MKQIIDVRIEWTGENYSAFADLNGLVFVTEKDVKKIKENFEQTFQFHVESSIEDGDDLLPADQYQLNYIYGATYLLKALEEVLSRSALSRVTGINQRQLGHYLQGVKKPRKSTEEKIQEGIRQVRDRLNQLV